MDRLFLDANILFSAAYGTNARLLRLWELERVELDTSDFAVEEAHRNLRTHHQRERLSRLLTGMRIVQESEHFTLPRGVLLPEKDRPILLAAIDASATHLLTGDFEHFGPYYRDVIGGVKILPPAEYLLESKPPSRSRKHHK